MADEEKYFKGRGAQVKPQNPYLKQYYASEHFEGIDEPFIAEKPKTQVFYEYPKKVVNKVDSPDVGMGYSLNAYQGCEHGCIYCYARNSHQYWGYDAGLDFESKIIVKPDAPKLLEQQLLKPGWRPQPIVLSGNTDCYQPLERKYKLTRQLLEIFLKYRHPVGIITKNALITRDLDILKKLASQDLIHVSFSITTLDEKLRSLLEPRTATAASKLNAMKLLSDAGIPVGLMHAPIIPGLTHHEIPAVLKAAAESGARSAGYTIVRLNGSIAEIFSDWLKKNFPDRYNKVWSQIAEVHGGKVNDSSWGRRMKGSGQIAEIISRLFLIHKQKYFANKSLPPYNLNIFRRGANLNLFE
jgi:DNA repair photolyase